jgi:hypothetical protein
LGYDDGGFLWFHAIASTRVYYWFFTKPSADVNNGCQYYMDGIEKIKPSNFSYKKDVRSSPIITWKPGVKTARRLLLAVE